MTQAGGTVDSLQERVTAWHVARFPAAQREHVALKGAEEMGEVASAINGDAGKNSATGRGGNAAEEAADVVICMLVLLGRWYPERDLLTEVERKLAILTDPNSGHRASLAATQTGRHQGGES